MAKNRKKCLKLEKMSKNEFVSRIPVAVAFNPFHEQIGNPESVKKVTCSRFLRARIFLGIEKFENVRMPGFQINGKGARSFISTLIYIP